MQKRQLLCLAQAWLVGCWGGGTAGGGAAARSRAYSRGRVTMMPEGPEVKSLAESLNLAVGNSRYRLAGCVAKTGRYSRSPLPGWDEASALISSGPPCILHSVRNKGKFMYFSFDNGMSLWSTLGLTGGWTTDSGAPSLRVSLHFESLAKSKVNQPQKILHFYDQRNFGTLKFSFSEEELEAKLDSLGFDWLDPALRPSLSEFIQLGQQAGKRKRPLAVWLMDQKKTSGIGNYVLSEVLYRTKIHPNATTDMIDERGFEDLFDSISEVLDSSYASQSPIVSDSLRPPFSFIIYAQRATSDAMAHPVTRSLGTHKRTVHWVPSVQTRFAPRGEQE